MRHFGLFFFCLQITEKHALSKPLSKQFSVSWLLSLLLLLLPLMMMEIEVKLLLPSRESYEKLIRHLSSKFIREYKQRNVFFDGTGRELFVSMRCPLLALYIFFFSFSPMGYNLD